MRERRVLPVGDFEGMRVNGRGGQCVGTIRSVAMDVESGALAYVVVMLARRGGSVALTAIPWASLSWPTDGGFPVLDVSHALLDDAECFDERDWPDLGCEAWGRVVHHRHGRAPYWQHPGFPRDRRQEATSA